MRQRAVRGTQQSVASALSGPSDEEDSSDLSRSCPAICPENTAN
jgi:hypothetical protein